MTYHQEKWQILYKIYMGNAIKNEFMRFSKVNKFFKIVGKIYKG